MRIRGDALLSAPVERVYPALHDPAVLTRAIPGVERLEELAPDRYRMTITAGVAAIKGSYEGEVALTDPRPPGSFVLRASGAGAPGTVRADVAVTLTDAGEGRTRVAYDADAEVGGMVGGVGQRVLAGVAKRTAGEFFRNVDDVLAGRVPTGAELPQQRVGEQVPVATATRAATAVTSSGDFVRGALVGAAIALAGVAVGAALAGRRTWRVTSEPGRVDSVDTSSGSTVFE